MRLSLPRRAMPAPPIARIAQFATMLWLIATTALAFAAVDPAHVKAIALGENEDKVKAIGALGASADPDALAFLESLQVGEVQTASDRILRVKDNDATDLLTGERESTRSLVSSTRSNWRRTVSLGWNAALSRSLEMRELARLSIHPPDFETPKIWEQILQFIQRFARTRNATTYRDWIGRQRTNQKAA